MEETAVPLAVDICGCLSAITSLKGTEGGLYDVHIGMLSRQTTTWTEPRALKTGVPRVWFSRIQSYALKVRPKLKKFLNMIRQVKPSMARSPVN